MAGLLLMAKHQRHAQRPKAAVARHRVPFHKVQIDLCALSIRFRKASGGMFWCPSTGFVRLEPLRTKTGQRVAKRFLEICYISETFPMRAQCDRGKEFLSSVFQELLTVMGVDRLEAQHKPLGSTASVNPRIRFLGQR